MPLRAGKPGSNGQRSAAKASHAANNRLLSALKEGPSFRSHFFFRNNYLFHGLFLLFVIGSLTAASQPPARKKKRLSVGKKEKSNK